ncbi:uncharacterized protein [Physcomitrium patens]|uniref:uncharacterized protein n=1 Tax=Physcomitrium patens TaxID=3218 RepID=UPI00024AE3F0
MCGVTELIAQVDASRVRAVLATAEPFTISVGVASAIAHVGCKMGGMQSQLQAASNVTRSGTGSKVRQTRINCTGRLPTLHWPSDIMGLLGTTTCYIEDWPQNYQKLYKSEKG